MFYSSHNIALRVIYTIALFVMMVLNFTACKDSANDGNSSYYTDNDLTIKMGGRTTFHNIKESDIENTSFPFSSAHYIYAYLDSEEFSNNIRHLCNDPDSYLNGERGCYISTKPIRRFSADFETETPSVMYFVFTKDMETAGEINLIENAGNMIYNGSYYNKSLNRHSLLVDFLKSDPEHYYIPLVDFNNLVLLDEKNVVVYGANKQNFSINGDVYHILKEYGFGVSYNEITSKYNCI